MSTRYQQSARRATRDKAQCKAGDFRLGRFGAWIKRLGSLKYGMHNSDSPGASTPNTVLVRPATLEDAQAVATIYNHYIVNTVVTFEEVEVSAAEVSGRISGVYGAGLPWLVAELAAGESSVVGYAYATGWKSRPAYRYTTEVSVYVAPGREGLGVGSALYGRLIPEITEKGIHVALGGIALPNIGSVALHEKFGFHKVAHMEEVGFKFGRWIDVGYWQRTL